MAIEKGNKRWFVLQRSLGYRMLGPSDPNIHQENASKSLEARLGLGYPLFLLDVHWISLDIPMGNNVGTSRTMKNIPQITISIGGINHSQMSGLLFLYPHYFQ